MAIKTDTHLNLEEYKEQQNKDNDLRIDTNIADMLREAPLTSNLIENEFKKAETKSNYETMNAISGHVSNLDSQEEKAKSRFATSMYAIEKNRDLLQKGELEKVTAKAEDAKEGNTNIIFTILEAINKPMKAMEGAVIGLSARNDEHYEGLNAWERTLAGISDGWNGEEDSEGNMIANDASVVASILTGDHDVSDWSLATKLMVGLPTLFLFGKYDPMMKAFSLLAESKYTVKGALNTFREKGIMPLLFQQREFNTSNFEESIQYLMDTEGTMTEEFFKGSLQVLTDKFNISGTSLLRDDGSVLDLTAYEKELHNLRKTVFNKANIDKDKYAAAVQTMRNTIQDTFTRAIDTGDVELLEDIGAFHVIKEFMGGDAYSQEDTIKIIRQISNPNSASAQEFRTALYQEMNSRLHRSFIGEKGYKLTMNEVLQDIIHNTGTNTTLTYDQLLGVYGKMLETGLIDVEQIAANLRSQKGTIIDRLDEIKKLKSELKDIKGGRNSFIKQLSKEAGDTLNLKNKEDILAYINDWATDASIKDTPIAGLFETFKKDHGDLTFNQIMKKFDELEKTSPELESKITELEKDGGSLKANDKAVKQFNDMLDVAEGRKYFSQNQQLRKKQEYLLDRAESMKKSQEKLLNRNNKKIEKISKRSQDLEEKVIGSSVGKYYTEGEKLYKDFKINKDQLQDLKFIVDNGHADKKPITEAMYQINNSFTHRNKIFNPNDPNHSIGWLFDATKEDTIEWLEGVKATDKEVYDVLTKDLKIDFHNKKTKGFANRPSKDRIDAIKNKIPANGNHSNLEPNESQIITRRDKALDSFKQIEYQVKEYIRLEKGREIEDVVSQIETLEPKLKKQRDRLTMIYDKYVDELSTLTTDDSQEIKDMIAEIKSNDVLISSIAKTRNGTQMNIEARAREIEQLKASNKELDKLISKEDTASAPVSGEDIRRIAGSTMGVTTLMPMLEEYFKIAPTTELVKDEDNIANILGLYTFSANTETKVGKAWKDELMDWVEGDAAQEFNKNFNWQNAPLVNQRGINALNEYINIGTQGKSFSSNQMQKISNGLKSIQSTAYTDMIRGALQNIEGGDQLADGFMSALTQHSNIITNEVMDSTAQYQKKLLNTHLNNKIKNNASNRIADDLTGEETRQRMNQGSMRSFMESGYRGSVDDINKVVGESFASRTGTSYNKYDITQQLFFDDASVSITQQVEDAKAFGEFGAVLTHAAQNGAFFTSSEAPAALVKAGRLKEVSGIDLKKALINMLKLDSADYNAAQQIREIEVSKVLEQAGMDPKSPQAIANHYDEIQKGMDNRADGYINNFIQNNFGDVLDKTGEDSFIYVPKELHRFLVPEKAAVKDLNGALAFFDKTMNWWKGLTLLSPGFNVKNFLGNFASQYTVSPTSLSFRGFDQGMSIYNKIPSFTKEVTRLSEKAVQEGHTSAEAIENFVLQTFKDNPKVFKEFHFDEIGINANDLYHLLKEGENSRIVDKSIASVIGRNENIGNLNVASSARDIGAAYRGSNLVNEVKKIDPGLQNVLTGIYGDTKKGSNIAKKLVDWNLQMSHDMTSSMKINQLIHNKKFENKLFQDWNKSLGRDVKSKNFSISELNEEIKNISSNERKSWDAFKKKGYRDAFGYDNSSSMIQDMFFDPGSLLGMEKSVVSRLVPFWGFFKKSLELSFKRLNKLDFRGLYGIQRGLDHFASMQGISKEDMSEFARNEQYLPFKIGENKIINLKWGNPTKTLNSLLVRDKNLVSELFGNTNPLLKFGVSEVANREDLFFGGKYDSLADEAFGTLAPGAVRNIQRSIKYEVGKDSKDMDHQKSVLARMLPSVFKDEVVSDNHTAAYNQAALIIEKQLNKLKYDRNFQISTNVVFPELPEYQDYILDLF